MHPESTQPWVPVVSSIGIPLMPCHPARARKLIAAGRAIPRYKKGLFYIKLLDRETGDTQPIALGIDPGSKMEGYTVKSEAHTYVNIQSHARDGNAIKKTMEARHNTRHTRRNKNTPCRAFRPNRARSANWVPPSTKARWQLKYNIFNWLCQLYPITCVIIEDVKARTKAGDYRWNNNFSPIQAGKNWLYSRLRATGVELRLVEGMDTYNLRQSLGLQKSKNKLATIFSAHCVDSWVLANSYVGGHISPELIEVLVLKPLSICKRQLHRFNPSKGGNRQRYGGSMSTGVKKGTLAIHPKHGKCYTGGYHSKTGLTLHTLISGQRLCRNAKVSDLQLVAYSPWVLLVPSTLSNHKEQRAQRRNYYRFHQSLSLTKFI